MPKLAVNGSFGQFVEPLHNLRDFDTHGSLHGRTSVPGSRGRIGRLPEKYHGSVTAADYVVYSYETPIAWHVPGEGWHVPPVKYSVTTSKQMGRIAPAISTVERITSLA